MSRLMTKPTKWHVRPAKSQINLGIRPVWSVFTVHMKQAWVLSSHWVHSKDSHQNGQTPRLIWVIVILLVLSWGSAITGHWNRTWYSTTDKVGIWWQLRDNFPYFSMKTCCGYSLESPHRGDSNESPQICFYGSDENYPLIIIKYLPYWLYWMTYTVQLTHSCLVYSSIFAKLSF